MNKESEFPAEYSEIINQIVIETRSIIESGNPIHTLVFFGNSTIKKLKVLLLQEFTVPYLSEEETTDKLRAEKDATAALIRRFAVDFGADMVLCISEAWYVDSKNPKGVDKILSTYGSMRNSPFKNDSIIFNLQTKTDAWTGVASLILQKDGPNRTFDNVDWHKIPDNKSLNGKLSSFLKQKPNK